MLDEELIKELRTLVEKPKRAVLVADTNGNIELKVRNVVGDLYYIDYTSNLIPFFQKWCEHQRTKEHYMYTGIDSLLVKPAIFEYDFHGGFYIIIALRGTKLI